MKMYASKALLAMAAMVVFGAPGFAQHGGGRPAGVGAGTGSGSMGSSAGAGMGAGMGSSARAGDMGPGSGASMRPSISSQSPGTALSNPHLDSSLTNALAKSGVTVPGGNLQTACSAFKNLGQCVAAMHVAKNLNLNFADLQGKMTGSGAESLGKAIQDLGGANVNAKSEAKKANKQASHDLNALDAVS